MSTDTQAAIRGNSMNIDLDELKQAIEGYPTEGWRHKNNSPDTFVDNLKREEAYHEAANPQTVLALLAEVERLRIVNERVRMWVERAIGKPSADNMFSEAEGWARGIVDDVTRTD